MNAKNTLSPGLLFALSEHNLFDSSCRACIRHRKNRKIATPTMKRNTREPSTPATILTVFWDVMGEFAGMVIELVDAIELVNAGKVVEEVEFWEGLLLVLLGWGRTKKPDNVYGA